MIKLDDNDISDDHKHGAITAISLFAAILAEKDVVLSSKIAVDVTKIMGLNINDVESYIYLFKNFKKLFKIKEE